MLFGVGRLVCSIGKRYPFPVGVSLATLKTGGSDLSTQLLIERKDAVDRPRLVCFTLLGFLWNGMLQQHVYVNVFARCFPHAARFSALPTVAARLRDGPGLRSLMMQVSFVNFIWNPIFYYFFYLFQEFVQGASSVSEQSTSLNVLSYVSSGLTRCREQFWVAVDRCSNNLWDDLRLCWAIWIPGHLFTFATPMWLRMPLTHSLSFFFYCALSFTRGDHDGTKLRVDVEYLERLGHVS
uniref:Mpv17-like protein n=1 Tax=Noctiluca scintillans TaxID=2966 RepID=A0A7S1A3A2_NOCSC|mmetsp:Transcript_29580/g.78273  ORF Transcript_29580/g.78273 Transcript_29580/m.78273 type:complete len:238 (+) Transcript_29580:44-757(+)